jgi:hypothetical protein
MSIIKLLNILLILLKYILLINLKNSRINLRNTFLDHLKISINRFYNNNNNYYYYSFLFSILLFLKIKFLTYIIYACSLVLFKNKSHVYVKNMDKNYVIICLYVDGMFILDNNDHMIKSAKKILNNKFDMKNLDIADIILGIKIYRTFD